MKTTVARALKLKNRVVAKITQVSEQITQYNSILKDKQRPVDIRTLLSKRSALVAALLGLKKAIYEANIPIQFRIFQNAELKGQITFLNGISTEEGISPHMARFGSDERIIEHVAEIKYQEVQDAVADSETQIDANQDEIDRFNHTTVIDIPDGIDALLK